MISEETLAKIRVETAKIKHILTGGISSTLDVKDIEAIAERVKSAPENIRIIWNLAQAEMKILDKNYSGTAHYSETDKGIRFNLQADITSPLQKPYRKFFHELGHFIDNWLEKYSGYHSVIFKNGLFKNILKKEAGNYVKATIKKLQLKNLVQSYKVISDELSDIPNINQHEISDRWHGATDKKVFGNWGHQKEG